MRHQFILSMLFSLLPAGLNVQAANTLVPAGVVRYAPGGFPDRIVAMPAADPKTAFAVAWRTDTTVDAAQIQVVAALDSPDLAGGARAIMAASRKLETENGSALHHHARVDGLLPDTLYAYRVQGYRTWSEWFHIRTAAAEPRAFSFLYFGDAQNSVKSLYSRVIREAWRREPQAALMLHAGDLVNGRAGEHDTEWGEWFDAGGFLHASAFVAPAPGNHEHDSEEQLGRDRYTLESHWAAQFPVPANGAPQLPHSTYSFDYQGVRFITLDSTSALNNGTAAAQASWLAPLLQDNPNRWTVVVYHHPMVSASLGRDNPPLRKHWMPLFERYGVDLVLQGHDHVYGRGTHGAASQRSNGSSGPREALIHPSTLRSEGYKCLKDQDGKNCGSRGMAIDQRFPVYVVSVAGPKQYRVSGAAQKTMTRHAENTQLYQVIRVDGNALNYESWTATGELYDAFDLTKNARGDKQLVERSISLPTRRCPHKQSPSGRKDRCWDGVEW